MGVHNTAQSPAPSPITHKHHYAVTLLSALRQTHSLQDFAAQAGAHSLQDSGSFLSISPHQLHAPNQPQPAPPKLVPVLVCKVIGNLYLRMVKVEPPFPKDLLLPMQGMLADYLTIAFFIVSTIYLTSSSVTYGPAGRHMPTLKIASVTPSTYAHFQWCFHHHYESFPLNSTNVSVPGSTAFKNR